VCATPHATVGDLALRGQLLASTESFTVRDQVGEGTEKLGLYNLRTRNRQAVAELIYGEGGEYIGDPEFLNGHTLAWFRGCTGDPGGCAKNAGVFRLNLTTGAAELAQVRGDNGGWAPLTPSSILLASTGQFGCGEGDGPACKIYDARVSYR